MRRDLILIGEDMVNVAFDAPVDFAPRDQIEDAERRLYELAEIGRYGGGFQKFETALTTAVDMAARAYQRDGKLSGLATGLKDLDSKMGGLQASDLIIVAGRPGMGKTALRHQHRLQHRQGLCAATTHADGHIETINGGIVGFFSLEMSAEQLATRIIAEQSGIPSSTIRRGGITEARFREDQGRRDRAAAPAVLHRRDRRPVDRPARRARAPAQAPARPRPPGDRLHPAAAGLEPRVPRKTASRR